MRFAIENDLTWSINSCLFRFVVFNAPPSECSNLSKTSISFHFESNTPVRGSTKAQWGSVVSLLWYILTKSTPKNNMRELDQNRLVIFSILWCATIRKLYGDRNWGSKTFKLLPNKTIKFLKIKRKNCRLYKVFKYYKRVTILQLKRKIGCSN